MTFGPSIMLGVGSRNYGAGSLPPFTSIATDGWQAVYSGTPTDLALTPFTVRRAGFDATGAAATISETLRTTKRVRQLFPNQASFTANNVALEDYIYQGDTVVGATNNSTAVSPKPVATWGMMDRTLVGNAIAWEILAFHRDARLGRQVACVQVRATDGTNTTDWQTVSTTSVSSYCEDAQPVEVFAGSLDITSLTDDRTITLQGRVLPWFGGSGSIIESNSESEFRFSNRFFYKNTTRLAAPNLIYVASTGNDTTGVVSTTPATAKATPALTVGGAINRLRTVLGTADVNTMSGAEIRIVDGVNMGSVTFNTSFRMDGAAVKVTRDPDVSRAAAAITWASGSVIRFHSTSNSGAVATESGIIFEDVTITRTADVTFLGESARKMHVQFRNVALNFSSTGAATGMMSNSFVSIFGMTATNFLNGFQFTSSGDFRILRGLSGSFNDSNISGYNVIGGSFTAARINASQAQRGALIYANHIPDPAGAGSASINVTSASSGQDIFGAVVQNLFPILRTGAQVNLRISGDSDNGNIVHMVVHHNTFPGDDTQGRANVFYDETAGTTRSHYGISWKGNSGPQFNMKPRDTFLDLTVTPGNFAVHHGVGCAGNFSEDLAPNDLDFNQAYGGIGTVLGGGNPLYVDDRAVSLPGPSAGSTGGDYKLQSGSPARDLFSQYLLGRDFAGVARPTSGTVDAGAYA